MGFNNTKTSLLRSRSSSRANLVSSSSIINTRRDTITTTTTTTTKKQKKRTRTFSSTSILYMTKTFVSFSIILTTVLMLHVVDAKIGYFWHITDIHFDTQYSTKGDIQKSCWHIEHHTTNNHLHPPGPYGDYFCDSPWSLLESATTAMRAKQGDNVEFVLWTGDGLAHSARRLLEQHRIDLLRNITDLLGRTFPSQFVFPVLGHEDGHGNSFDRLGDLWRHWLPSEALQTFEKGGYYTIEQTKSRLRIIALNTNYMRHDPKYSQSHLSAVRQKSGHPDDRHSYSNTFYHHKQGYRKYDVDAAAEDTRRWHNRDRNRGHSSVDGGTVSALSGSSHEAEKQWEWLESVLDKSKRNKETVYIIGHIPPGSDERQIGEIPNGHTTFSEVNNLRYIRLVRKYSSIIQGQFFGHLHSDSFRIVYDDGKPVSWMMVAPSLTPRKMNVGSNNPALRLYKFDTDTGQVLDYSQYYLDLASANLNNEPDWQLEYNLTYYYGLTEVTAVSLHNLADRFSNSEDSLFGKYYRANSVRHTTTACEGVCALNHYCAITRVDYREYKECFQTAASALASTASRPKFFLCFNKKYCNLSNVLTIQLMTTNSITREMLMYYFLIITALFVMQLEQLKQVTYLTVLSVVSAMSLLLLVLPKNVRTSNAGISIKSTSS